MPQAEGVKPVVLRFSLQVNGPVPEVVRHWHGADGIHHNCSTSFLNAVGVAIPDS
jgi:hypothetical protein